MMPVFIKNSQRLMDFSSKYVRLCVGLERLKALNLDEKWYLGSKSLLFFPKSSSRRIFAGNESFERLFQGSLGVDMKKMLLCYGNHKVPLPR